MSSYAFPIFNISVKSVSSNGFNGFHSLSTTIDRCNMKVHVLPALQDNYMYLVCIAVSLSLSVSLSHLYIII